MCWDVQLNGGSAIEKVVRNALGVDGTLQQVAVGMCHYVSNSGLLSTLSTSSMTSSRLQQVSDTSRAADGCVMPLPYEMRNWESCSSDSPCLTSGTSTLLQSQVQAASPSSAPGGSAIIAEGEWCHLLSRIRLQLQTKRVKVFVLELVLAANGLKLPPAFARQLQAMLKELGIILIIDECYTALRCDSFCLSLSQEYRLQPDFIVLGKATGLGFIMARPSLEAERQQAPASARMGLFQHAIVSPLGGMMGRVLPSFPDEHLKGLFVDLVHLRTLGLIRLTTEGCHEGGPNRMRLFDSSPIQKAAEQTRLRVSSMLRQGISKSLSLSTQTTAIGESQNKGTWGCGCMVFSTEAFQLTYDVSFGTQPRRVQFASSFAVGPVQGNRLTPALDLALVLEARTAGQHATLEASVIQPSMSGSNAPVNMIRKSFLHLYRTLEQYLPALPQSSHDKCEATTETARIPPLEHLAPRLAAYLHRHRSSQSKVLPDGFRLDVSTKVLHHRGWWDPSIWPQANTASELDLEMSNPDAQHFYTLLRQIRTHQAREIESSEPNALRPCPPRLLASVPKELEQGDIWSDLSDKHLMRFFALAVVPGQVVGVTRLDVSGSTEGDSLIIREDLPAYVPVRAHTGAPALTPKQAFKAFRERLPPGHSQDVAFWGSLYIMPGFRRQDSVKNGAFWHLLRSVVHFCVDNNITHMIICTHIPPWNNLLQALPGADLIGNPQGYSWPQGHCQELSSTSTPAQLWGVQDVPAFGQQLGLLF
jgi:hypothetical protein